MDAQAKPRDQVDSERNGEVLRELLAVSETVLRAQARRHTELAVDVEEALQSTYELFIERYRGEGEPLAWLQTTVKREAWRIARRASRQREVGMADLRSWAESIRAEGQTPWELAVRAEEVAERLALLRRLKPDQHRAVVLVAAGYTYAEVASLSGWSETKVRRSVNEGRAALRMGEQIAALAS